MVVWVLFALIGKPNVALTYTFASKVDCEAALHNIKMEFRPAEGVCTKASK
jgi:hypothetical protein